MYLQIYASRYHSLILIATIIILSFAILGKWLIAYCLSHSFEHDSKLKLGRNWLCNFTSDFPMEYTGEYKTKEISIFILFVRCEREIFANIFEIMPAAIFWIELHLQTHNNNELAKSCGRYNLFSINKKIKINFKINLI